ncbi:hypothetical protein AB0J35_56675 [Nonomuraea angiospora]|uniref:hypothetical protein n=1 Tax=Nonomuraea angiospora TaxID=46172 RepID=UPI0034490156
MTRRGGEFAVGVWGSSWATGLQGAQLDREFAGEQEAIAALEAQELDWLNAGKVLTEVQAVPGALEQIVDNLVSNALRPATSAPAATSRLSAQHRLPRRARASSR